MASNTSTNVLGVYSSIIGTCKSKRDDRTALQSNLTLQNVILRRFLTFHTHLKEKTLQKFKFYLKKCVFQSEK